MSYSQIIIHGNMGKGAEYKESSGGKAYLKFSIAVNQWDSQARQEKPAWFNCQMWDNQSNNRLDKIRPYLEGEENTGKKLLVIGTPTFWQDDNGNNVLSIKVNEIDFGAKSETKESKTRESETSNSGVPF